MSKTTWTGSPNYWSGRTQPIKKIIVHWMNGYLAGADKVFNSNVGTDAATSAHYGIEDDTIHQYVRVEDTAWHARQANPYSIGIEHSAAPGRDASDKTYASSIELIASLVKQYVLDPDTDIEYHKKYVATSCSDLDINRIITGVKAALAGEPAPVPTPTPVVAPVAPANQNTSGSIHLPEEATSWRVYPPEGAYTIGHEVGRLNPSLGDNGLDYEILGNPAPNIYLIKSRDFGEVAIYGGAETGAIVNVSGQGITKGTGPSTTVTLPAGVPAWKVYRQDGPYTVGNQIGSLNTEMYGSLTYAVLAQPLDNVVVITTRDYGTVAIYVGSETGATIKQ